MTELFKVWNGSRLYTEYLNSLRHRCATMIWLQIS